VGLIGSGGASNLLDLLALAVLPRSVKMQKMSKIGCLMVGNQLLLLQLFT
jgi:hypothetical protein